jgi:cyclophilin family peptidyl-prolyl cis-trans isomerase
LLSIIYTINLPVVRPRSCRVIYYFDTPALGRRHQSFGRVTEMLFSLKIKPLKTLKKKKKTEFAFFIHTNLYPRPTI